MADPFVAEVRIFPFNFAPTGWAFCNGQLLPPSQNTALFALLGSTYGGDGKSTFALPDLQGRVPMEPGQGAGLSNYALGQSGGTETVTLLQSEIPSHMHAVQASRLPATSNVPANSMLAASISPVLAYAAPPPWPAPIGPAAAQLAPQALVPAGGGAPHNNLQPYLTLNFCIAVQGVFPSQG